MRKAPFLLVAMALICNSAPARDRKDASDKHLREAIEKILTDPEAARGVWGIQVASLSDGRSLYSQNADRLFVPASNLKLFTIAGTFALVGGDYLFSTTVEAAHPPDKFGRIAGDVSLVGRGDPNLSGRALPYTVKTEHNRPALWVLDDFADQLVRAGVKQTDGGIVGDDSFYPNDRFAEGWSQDDLQWYYGAPASALTVNDNVIAANMLPGEHVGDAAFVTFDPPTNYYEIENRVVTIAAGGKRQIGIRREPGSKRIEFWGGIPLGDTGENEELAIDDPAEFAAQAFKESLIKRGVAVYGAARALHRDILTLPAELPPAPPTAPPTPAPASNAVVLATHNSLPLAEDLKVIAKISQNLHAELAMRLMGRQRGWAGTDDAGVQVLATFLSQAGITPQEYSLHDGSGLSRQDLFTPNAMVKLLRYAATQSWGAKFEDTLPIAGVDGSLFDRLKGPTTAGKVHAKTGGLDHVNTLSGYLTTTSGERVAFSILANNHQMAGMGAVDTIGKIVEAIAQAKPPHH